MGRSVSERQSHPEVQEPRFQPGVQEFQDMFRTLQAGGLCAVDFEKKVSIHTYQHYIILLSIIIIITTFRLPSLCTVVPIDVQY